MQISIVVVYLMCFMLSTLLTYAMIHLASRRGIMDIPNERSSHEIPVPRGGGLVFVLLFLLLPFPLMAFALFPIIEPAHVTGLLIGSGLIGAVGFLDDIYDLRAAIRLLIQLIVLGFVVNTIGIPSVIDFGDSGILLYLGYFITVIGSAWLINLFNFMDGIDGIASVEVITVLLSAIALMFYKFGNVNELMYWMLLIVILVAGFLVWNWSPAKIFMGDAGSSFLGYLLAVMAIMSANTDLVSIWSWIILLGVFIADTTVTLMRRILAGETWYRAHRSHAYQYLALRLGHKPVTLLVLATNVVWLFPLAFLNETMPGHDFYITLLAYAPLVLFVIMMNRYNRMKPVPDTAG